MKIEGILTLVHDTVTVSNGFRKRNFVLLYNDRGHMEHLWFELFQEQCELIDDFSIKDRINVEFNLKGRRWTDKEGKERFINTLQAWSIQKIDG